MKDDNVYVKMDNGRYRPFGRRYDEQYLPDGIWYCHHDEHSCGHTNVDHYIQGLYKVGDVEHIDLPKLCGLEEYKNYILYSSKYKELMDKNYYTMNELVSAIIALIFEYNEENKR